MKYTPGILREVLHSLIRKLGETPEQFVRRPGRDFTRPRTLRFETVISLLLTMSENSVGKALIKRFKSMENTPSASALVQQREKLLPAALETLFQRFTACLRPTGHFQGYRLLAADGSESEVRRVSRGSRLLPAWDSASARLESLAFECAL